MEYTTVKCQNCGKFMVPRTTYARGFLSGPYPCSNHCPFCLSSNWDGSAPGFGKRMLWLLGVSLGVLACVLVGATLFKLQWLTGIEGTYPWLTLLTCIISAYGGYAFYNWFTSWED